MKEVIVIGGGAAGILAAAAAARQGAAVRLLEKKSRPLLKLMITGKGRCNVTTALPLAEQLEHYAQGSKFLHSALVQFSNQDMIRLLEDMGCPTKTERGGRVFPLSDRAEDVARALQNYACAAGVRLMCNVPVNAVRRQGNRFIVISGKQRWTGDALIIATGGLSYPQTGSTGDGYAWGAAWGHEIIAPRPSLAPLVVREAWARELKGLSLKNVRLTVLDGETRINQEFGEMLFTHHGISGPIALSMSRDVMERIDRTKQPVRMALDLKPALDAPTLDKRLLRDFSQQPRRQLHTVLAGLAPRRLADVLNRNSRIPPEKLCGDITREERLRLGRTLKQLVFTVTGCRPIEEAIVTAGGISVKDVWPKTMESKRISNLYWAGEVLDVDARTGGFNLQAAWSTGWAAGCAAAREKDLSSP
jgi:predicted Rossmann fold flavoprotein